MEQPRPSSVSGVDFRSFAHLIVLQTSGSHTFLVPWTPINILFICDTPKLQSWFPLSSAYIHDIFYDYIQLFLCVSLLSVAILTYYNIDWVVVTLQRLTLTFSAASGITEEDNETHDELEILLVNAGLLASHSLCVRPKCLVLRFTWSRPVEFACLIYLLDSVWHLPKRNLNSLWKVEKKRSLES